VIVNVDGVSITLTVPQNTTLCHLRLKLQSRFRNQDLDLYLAKNNFKIDQELQEMYAVDSIGIFIIILLTLFIIITI